MANTFTADFAEIWAKEQQDVFYRENVARMIADTSFSSQMKRGDTLNRPYRSSGSDGSTSLQTYTRGTAIAIDDLTDTQEQLSVNSEYATGFYIDDFDKIQSNYDLAAAYGRDHGIYLSNQVDADILGEYANADATVDAGDVGGTDGDGIALTTSNVLDVIATAKQELAKNNVPMNDLVGVISPEFENVLIQYGAGRDTSMGDTANQNGFFTNFYGFKLYRSNVLSGSAVLSLATQVTADDTVTVNGVTFTFKAAPAAAGEVDIGGDVDTTRANLAAAINGGAGAGSAYIEVSTANRRKLNNCTATNDNDANTLTVVYKGVGRLIVSKNLTDPTDTWTANKVKQHNLFGARGGSTLVMQKEPSVQIKEVPDKLGKNILNGVLYGYKTFTDGAKKLVNVEIKGSTFTA